MAKEDTTTMRAIDPEEAKRLLAVGIKCLGKKDFTSAVDALNEARIHDPSMPEPHHYLGEAYMEMDLPSHATHAFEEALDLHESETNYCSLAKAYY